MRGLTIPRRPMPATRCMRRAPPKLCRCGGWRRPARAPDYDPISSLFLFDSISAEVHARLPDTGVRRIPHSCCKVSQTDMFYSTLVSASFDVCGANHVTPLSDLFDHERLQLLGGVTRWISPLRQKTVTYRGQPNDSPNLRT